MALVDFINRLHTSTKRDYVARVVAHDKAHCAEVALRYDKDYWDGERQYGFGGYKYDGRWKPVAQAMAEHYKLKPGARVLEVGCGKGFLLYEFTQVVPDCQVDGFDISQYGLDHAKPEIRSRLKKASAGEKFPYADKSFDLVFSVMTLHNLYNYELKTCLQEMERVGRGGKHFTIESYTNEREKANFLYWQLTCRTFWAPKEWEWFMKESGYTGDYGFVVFE